MGLRQFIDDYINSRMFQPRRYKFDLKKFDTNFSKIYTTITKTNNKIYFIIITPYYNTNVDKYIIYSHGTGDDIETVFEYGQKFANTFNVGFITYDYPGYAWSTGNASEMGCYESMNVIMNYVINVMNIEEKNIILFGHSLGTGIVIDYAFKNNWKYPIVLISAYKSIITVIYDNIIIDSFDKFINISKIGKLSCPIKFYHGENDNFIKISHSKTLWNKTKNKMFNPSWIINADHNNIIDMLLYDKELYRIIHN